MKYEKREYRKSRVTIVFYMNEFSEKTFVATNGRKQPGNEDSSGTHKKEKQHLFLRDNGWGSER
jgi:hypothetical protein